MQTTKTKSTQKEITKRKLLSLAKQKHYGINYSSNFFQVECRENLKVKLR